MIRHIKTSCLFVLLAIMVYSCSKHTQDVEPSAVLEPVDLISDLDTFEDRMLNDHPYLRNPGQRYLFISRCDNIRDLLDHPITLKAFYEKIAFLAATLRCGHTRLNFPDHYWEKIDKQYKHLPFRLFFSDTSIYIRDVYYEDTLLKKGAKVLQVNNRLSGEIVRELLSLFPADGSNTTYKYYNLNGRLYGIETPGKFYPNKYLIKAILPGQKVPLEFEVSAQSKDSIMAFIANRGDDFEEYKSYQFSQLDSLNVAIITIRDFIDFSRGSFSSFLEDAFSQINEKKMKALIIDLRGNDGGDPDHAAELLSFILHKPLTYFNQGVYGYSNLKKPVKLNKNNFDGNMFVLMDGGSFSTTGHLLSLLKYYKIGILIGETSGGSWQCNGCYGDYEFPNTGLHLMYPRCVFRTAVDGQGMEAGIKPDEWAVPTVKDLIHKKDVVLEKAISMIKQSKN